MLDASFQGVKKLLVPIFYGTAVNEDINLTNNTNNRVERDSHQMLSSKSKYNQLQHID